MKLSVVTPTYNSEKFIGDCVESVSSQNFPDLEHIIIDGLSTDKTLEIVKSHAHLKLTSESDEGQSDALNKGFQKATGDWILWLNSDDYILPGTLEAFEKTLSKNPTANVIYGHMSYVDADKKEFKKIYNIPFNLKFGRFGLYMPPSTGTFFKASFLKENPLSLKHHYTMDTDLFFRCKDILKTAVIPKFTVAFRFWEENKTASVLANATLPEQHQKERKFNLANYNFKSWQGDSEKMINFKFKVSHYFYKPAYYLKKIQAKFSTQN